MVNKKTIKLVKSTQHIPEKPLKQGMKQATYEEYLDLFIFRQKPVNEAFIERKAQEWREWVDEEHKDPRKDALRVWDFWDQQKIGKRDVCRWMKKFDFLFETHAYVKRKVASRREIGAITKQYDSNYISRYMPLYDSSIKKLEEWRANLKKEANMGSGTIVIQVPEVPSSKMVPERKKNDEEKKS